MEKHSIKNVRLQYPVSGARQLKNQLANKNSLENILSAFFGEFIVVIGFPCWEICMISNQEIGLTDVRSCHAPATGDRLARIKVAISAKANKFVRCESGLTEKNVLYSE